MDDVKIRAVTEIEAPRAVSTQLMAFSSDPAMRWMWREPHEYLRHFPPFVRAFGGRAFEHGTAYVAGDFHGGSLWLPAGVVPDGAALEALITETLQEPARSAAPAIIEQMAECHPHEPHWHLAFIGVDPPHQGQGIGAALLRHTLALIDAEGVHSYLESSNPANIPLYQRHGFEVVREIRVGPSPVITPMVRPPR